VVHDLLAEQPRAQVELQKTATGFDIPGLTTVGASSPLYTNIENPIVPCNALRSWPGTHHDVCLSGHVGKQQQVRLNFAHSNMHSRMWS
jgi:hypothetical protein